MNLLPFDDCKGLEVTAEVRRFEAGLEFVFALRGDTSDIVIPPAVAPARADGLWQGTCFEAFISIGQSSYLELNFAPSGQWAAYHFTNTRQDMSDFDVAPPEIRFASYRLVARIALAARAEVAINLAAVIEHRSGARSYWALAHHSDNRPDFHSRDCFVAKLP